MEAISILTTSSRISGSLFVIGRESMTEGALAELSETTTEDYGIPVLPELVSGFLVD
ncbi:hypothetical protein [Haloarcula onubensis]|jgi:hypothetical protein|uniref:Uncharacterized protein n=1 Tax=Haloarcula onubensis TaxID=2950539 RepID=A0ABU2FSK6_9EURY|nr:hypothetical protein [Halomicroarcula sp. S3CR25-11]MDS0283735.1 hypothetical protein [Halomicroarcula sp. S3CR25-11]